MRIAISRLNGRVALSGIALFAFAALARPALARDNLGMFGAWGAFRDADVPRCYAISLPSAGTRGGAYRAYADVAVWPRKKVRNQVHFRLSHKVAPGAKIVLAVASKRFELSGGGGDAWAADRRMDAAIVAAMRSASGMTLTARAAGGKRFYQTWRLEGVASAMDAAAIGCARLK